MNLKDLGFDPKNKTHNGQLTRAEGILLGLLWLDHVGEANAIAAQDLAVLFDYALRGHTFDREDLPMFLHRLKSTPAGRRELDILKREVRKVHNHLLKDHDVAILSKAGHGGGYWIAESKAEAAIFYATFRQRGLTGLIKASCGKRALFVEGMEQAVLEFEKIRDRSGLDDAPDESVAPAIVDRFLEKMSADPERFAKDLRRIGEKFGGVLWTKGQVAAMKAKVAELGQIIGGL